MVVLYGVIDDVYAHTVGVVLRFLGFSLTKESAPVIHLPSSRGASKPEEVVSMVKETPLPQTFRPLSSVMVERAQNTDLSRTIAYVASARAPLFGTPTKEFDTVVITLPYGSMVMVLEEKGRFSKVSGNGLTGWVLRDDLADRAAHVYPEFVQGEENMGDDPNTLRLRAFIKDEFHGGETESPLQAGEYVLYKLMRKELVINWPPARPRTPGRWHTILRGVPGIYIGIIPKTGSVMECSLENDTGHLAYVEAVFPDERITISQANNPDNGMYSERTLRKEEWQALNPIFIQVS